jgi:hypothetical protein
MLILHNPSFTEKKKLDNTEKKKLDKACHKVLEKIKC